jgi:hypothetical protein
MIYVNEDQSEFYVFTYHTSPMFHPNRTDMDMQSKVEMLLYTTKDLLPGLLDSTKVEAARSLLSSSVEIRNPLVCYQGIDRSFSSLPLSFVLYWLPHRPSLEISFLKCLSVLIIAKCC